MILQERPGSYVYNQYLLAQFHHHISCHNYFFYIEPIIHQCNFLDGVDTILLYAQSVVGTRAIYDTCCGNAQNYFTIGKKLRTLFLKCFRLKFIFSVSVIYKDYLSSIYILKTNSPILDFSACPHQETLGG